LAIITILLFCAAIFRINPEKEAEALSRNKTKGSIPLRAHERLVVENANRPECGDW